MFKDLGSNETISTQFSTTKLKFSNNDSINSSPNMTNNLLVKTSYTESSANNSSSPKRRQLPQIPTAVSKTADHQIKPPRISYKLLTWLHYLLK